MAERVARRDRSHGNDGESGFTLIELLVAMGVFLVFISILLGSIVALSRGTSRVQTTAQSTNGALVVFSRLDRQVRYADAINFPGTDAQGIRYIEFRVPAASSANGLTTCYQWRYRPALNTIESRQWTDAGGAIATSWSTKLSDVIDDGGVGYPFGLKQADTSGTTQQQLILSIDAGNGTLKSGAAITSNFIARNSSVTSTSNTDANNDGVSDTPVCLSTGSRS